MILLSAATSNPSRKASINLTNVFVSTFINDSKWYLNVIDKNWKYKIRNYDLLLHLSKREGLPVSVMESLSQGLPVICTNIRGNNDLIKEGFNGFFVNSYKDVPNKILYLNLNKEVFNEMRYNSLKSITKDFSKKQINRKIIKYLDIWLNFFLYLNNK